MMRMAAGDEAGEAAGSEHVVKTGFKCTSNRCRITTVARTVPFCIVCDVDPNLETDAELISAQKSS